MRWSINYIFLLLSVIFQSVSSVLSKFAATDLQKDSLFFVMLNGYYLAAIVCLFLQAIFWQITLRKIELSVAYPLTSLNNVFILIFSYFIFNEAVTLNNILGVLIIMIGIVIQNIKSETK